MFEYVELMTEDRIRIAEPLSSEGTCGGRPVLPYCSQPVQVGRLLGALSRQVLNTSKDGVSTTSLGRPFSCLTTLTVRKKSGISHTSLCAHCLSSYWAPPRRAWLHLLYSPISYLSPPLPIGIYTLNRSPLCLYALNCSERSAPEPP